MRKVLSGSDFWIGFGFAGVFNMIVMYATGASTLKKAAIYGALYILLTAVTVFFDKKREELRDEE